MKDMGFNDVYHGVTTTNVHDSSIWCQDFLMNGGVNTPNSLHFKDTLTYDNSWLFQRNLYIHLSGTGSIGIDGIPVSGIPLEVYGQTRSSSFYTTGGGTFGYLSVGSGSIFNGTTYFKGTATQDVFVEKDGSGATGHGFLHLQAGGSTPSITFAGNNFNFADSSGTKQFNLYTMALTGTIAIDSMMKQVDSATSGTVVALNKLQLREIGTSPTITITDPSAHIHGQLWEISSTSTATVTWTTTANFDASLSAGITITPYTPLDLEYMYQGAGVYKWSKK